MGRKRVVLIIEPHIAPAGCRLPVARRAHRKGICSTSPGVAPSVLSGHSGWCGSRRGHSIHGLLASPPTANWPTARQSGRISKAISNRNRHRESTSTARTKRGRHALDRRNRSGAVSDGVRRGNVSSLYFSLKFHIAAENRLF